MTPPIMVMEWLRLGNVRGGWPRFGAAAALLCGCAMAAVGVTPKVVVQLGHQSPVRATLWTPDGRFVISLADDGSLVVWNVANQQVVDRGQIPWPGGGSIADVQRFAMTAPGTARITLAADPHCPPLSAGHGNCTFDLDLATRVVTPAAGGVAGGVAGDAAGDAAGGAAGGAATPGAGAAPPSLYAYSPDGSRQAYPNHGAGVPGLVNLRDENVQFDDVDCTSLKLCRYGVNLVMTTAPFTTTSLTGNPRSYFLDADLSPDGRRLVRVESIRNKTDARIQLLDLADSSGSSVFLPHAAYHRVRWLGDRYVIFSRGYTATNDVGPSGSVPPALIVDPACSRPVRPTPCASIPAHGLMRPLDPQGGFVGTGSLAGCFMAPDDFDADGVACIDESNGGSDGHPHWSRLEFATPAAAPGAARTARIWTPRAVPQLAGQSITAVEVGPDSQQIAVATKAATATSTTIKVVLLGASAQMPVREVWSISEPVTTSAAGVPTLDALAFSSDGKQLLFDYRNNLVIVDPSGVRAPRQVPFDARQIISDGSRALGLENQTLIDLATGAPVAAPFAVGRLLRGGFIAGKPVVWAASDDGVLHFWHSTTGTLLLTVFSFPDNRFFALRPDGRYDTNLGPDTNEVRWLMPDAPWQSLAAQTFMRDYYEPQLMQRVFQCAASNTCETAFRPLRSLENVNRLLPRVEVGGVVPGVVPGTAEVCVTAAETVAHAAGGAEIRSGLNDLRLFRDGRLVAERGAAPAELDPDDYGQWTKRTAIAAQSCPDRSAVFTVAVPTDGKPVKFNAYAFNTDRVKGETSATVTYQPPTVNPSRTPRAYVIAIGVNAYVKLPDKSLNFAVSDAESILQVLRSVPGHEVVGVELTSDLTKNHATKADIRAVFALLAGDQVADSTARLKADGIETGTLTRATPDDVVIVTYSGHGYADARGNFYLLPSDTAAAAGSGAPTLATMISSAELTDWLRDVDAGDMAMVIDACHAAASVAAGEFKPGPMGDPGLGQLAYDKGIRLLAATQADDVALEAASVHQGLLTFALAGNGEALSAEGNADLRGDHKITLDEWLRYGAKRVPGLSDDVRLGRLAPGASERGFTFVNAAPAAPPRVQEPSLFDFTGRVSPVVLRTIRP